MHHGFKIHVAHAPSEIPNDDSRKLLILLDMNCDAQLEQMAMNRLLARTGSGRNLLRPQGSGIRVAFLALAGIPARLSNHAPIGKAH